MRKTRPSRYRYSYESEITIAANERIVDAIADRDAEAASAAVINVNFNGLPRHGEKGIETP